MKSILISGMILLKTTDSQFVRVSFDFFTHLHTRYQSAICYVITQKLTGNPDKNHARLIIYLNIQKLTHYGTLMRVIARQKPQKNTPYKMFKKSLTCADFRYNIGSVIRA